MSPSGIAEAFAGLEDPRREHGQLHQLLDIIIIAICAVISGAETRVDIVDFGEDKQEWLKRFLELPNGIPSHDTFARVFQLLDPQQVQQRCQDWIRSIKPVLTEGDIGDCHLPRRHQPQGHFQHEAPPRSGHHRASALQERLPWSG